MIDWNQLKVSELQAKGILLVEDGNHGEYRPRQGEFVDGETAFIRAADMSDGRILFGSADKINKQAFERIRKGKGKGGDILLSHKGTVGKLALVPLDAPPFVCSPQTTFWRVVDEKSLNREFLYYYMQSPGFTNQWKARKGETDMADYVSLTAQREFKIPLPPLPDQEAVARILLSFDNKIALLHKMNETLEAISHALFKAWFVEHEPVRANMEGRPAKSTSRAFSKLFPSEFEGHVPKGWKERPLADFLQLIGGGTPKTSIPEFWGGNVLWYSVVDAPTDSDVFVIDTEKKITNAGLDGSSARLLRKGVTIISARGTVGKLAITGAEMAMNQSCYAVTSELGDYFTFYTLKEAIAALKQNTHGAVFDTITQDTFKSVLGLLPDTILIREFEKVVSPLMETIANNLLERRTLQNLRNTLLPLLISGQLKLD